MISGEFARETAFLSPGICQNGRKVSSRMRWSKSAAHQFHQVPTIARLVAQNIDQTNDGSRINHLRQRLSPY
jgi:hypothetical protein